jgi:hypothetical protein
MEMGLVKWDILSIDIYSQIGQCVYTFSKKNEGVVNWHMEPNGTCITINFEKESITYKCLQVVGKSHIDR